MTGKESNGVWDEDEIEEPEPEPETEKKKDELKCPKGFPKEKWERWCESERLNYLKIIGGI